MIRRRFLQSDDFPKMLSQLSNQLILPPRIPGFRRIPSDDTPKKPRFRRELVAPAAPSTVGKYPFLEWPKNRSFRGAGAAELRNFLFYRLGNRGFACPKAEGFNLPRKESFSGTRTIRADANPLSDGLSGSKISRVGRIDGQKALFNYLHCNRSLNFTDAEHMSKNCPVFLQKLLTKVENEQDTGRSLTRFLNFHPINEFEPFLESLGLKPFELHPLLPRKLMFLGDDDILIENYQVLCNYGVPRIKIGKMYKEATEMFRYDYGILMLKIQAYEKLGLSTPTVIKLVTCCPTLLVGDVNVEFLQVLEKLKVLGVELDCIRGCFSDKSMYNWSRILEMLNFLDGMGCNKKDLISLIKEHPRFVFDDSGKKIYVLVAMLLKLGLKMNKILVLFVQYPRILVGNFAKNLWRSVNFLFEIGMDSEDIAMIVCTHPQVLGSCSCKKVESVLTYLNFTAERLCEIIKEDPNQLSLASRGNISVADLPKVEGIFLREKTNFLLKIGFVENSDEMAKAVRKFRGRGDQLQERFDCLVDAGLDYHTVTEMVKLVPTVLNQSTDVLEKKIDYLVNHFGYPLESLAAFPAYLCYNMEKIKLRFSMYKWLKEHGIVIPTKSRKMIMSTVALSALLACADARFEKYIVCLHPEGPEVWETLKKQYVQAKGGLSL